VSRWLTAAEVDDLLTRRLAQVSPLIAQLQSAARPLYERDDSTLSGTGASFAVFGVPQIVLPASGIWEVDWGANATAQSTAFYATYYNLSVNGVAEGPSALLAGSQFDNGHVGSKVVDSFAEGDVLRIGGAADTAGKSFSTSYRWIAARWVGV
jgi:hypothetical protein